MKDKDKEKILASGRTLQGFQIFYTDLGRLNQ